MTTKDAATVLREFTKVWGEIATCLPADYDCFLTCIEAEALADLFRAVGDDETADYIIAEHASGDDEGDAHYAG